MSSPLQRYQRDIESGGFSHDQAQAHAVACLQRLYEELIAAPPTTQGRGLAGVFARFRKAPPVASIKGLYFWGGVGRGKTYLMDTFYDTLPFDDKLRAHFHRFMQRVHRELKDLAGEKNPLVMVADRIADGKKMLRS